MKKESKSKEIIDILSNSTKKSKKMRFGLICSNSKQLNTKALGYLVLELNKQQSEFEYNFHQYEDSKEIDNLSMTIESNLAATLKDANDKFDKYIKKLSANYDIISNKADCLIFITTSQRNDNYYFWLSGNTAIIALGNWEKNLAPPSIIEFVLTLILQISLLYKYNITPHIETKGCLFDFTPYLDEARYKTLVGYICQDCVEKIPKTTYLEISKILAMDWVGDYTDEKSPASIVRKLGFYLFRTKNFKPNFLRRLMGKIEDDGISEFIKFILYILGIIILVWLGYKNCI